MRPLLRVHLSGAADSRPAAHALLRRALSQARPDVAPDNWRFARDERGKPHVAPGLPPLSFSLTHCRGLAAVAVAAADIAVGVDAEPLTRRVEPLRLAQRFFTVQEADALAAMDDDEARRSAFLRLWTLKEATVKALGTGIAGSLQGFAFDSCDPPRFTAFDPALGAAEEWFFWRRDWAEFSVALALRLGLAQKIDIDFQIAEPPP